MGGAAASDRVATKAAIVNSAVNTPTGCAFMLDGDLEHVYVGHSPTGYPSDPTAATPFDGLITFLVGNDIRNVTAVVLPNDSFQRTGDTNAYEMAYLTRIQWFGAGPPVLRHAIAPVGTLRAAALRSRPIMLLPRSVLMTCLTDVPDGRYTMLAFYNSIIQPLLSSGVAAKVTLITPLAE